jgi:hypothetical protein
MEYSPRAGGRRPSSPEFEGPLACPRPPPIGPASPELPASPQERARPGPALASHGRNGDRGDGRARPGSTRLDGPAPRG